VQLREAERKTVMRNLLLLLVILVSGCTLSPNAFRPNTDEVVSEKMESPFFSVPPLNLQDFKDRNWILLAESANRKWYYDPYTLTQDEDGVISFDAFNAPRIDAKDLDQFNATIVGPYLQKIDCFSSNQWSETFYTKNLPTPKVTSSPAKPINGSGWVKIQPRTAMAYIRTRLCGRKFIDDANVNYFLYQDGEMPIVKSNPKASSSQYADKSVSTAQVTATQVTIDDVTPKVAPTFFEVINNEVIVVDAKKDIREMKIASYTLEKEFPKKAEFVYRADCQGNTNHLLGSDKKLVIAGPVGPKGSLSSVAFNRACENHGDYMKVTSKSGK